VPFSLPLLLIPIHTYTLFAIDTFMRHKKFHSLLLTCDMKETTVRRKYMLKFQLVPQYLRHLFVLNREREKREENKREQRRRRKRKREEIRREMKRNEIFPSK
jgi:hypothetical protein